MQIPKSIRIADRLYSVEKWDSRLAMAAGRFGECDKSNRIIRVDAGYGLYQAASTLLHEVLHGIFHEYSIEDEDKEERAVGTLQTALMQVFIDNPDFAALVLAEAEKSRAIFSSCRHSRG